MSLTTWVELGGAIATGLATFFAYKALRAAERTVKLELEAQQERDVQRKLDLLDRLLLSTYELEQAAMKVTQHLPALIAVEARGRYQVAYLAASAEFPELSACEQLSKEADVEKIVPLAPHASSEIRSARRSVRDSEPDR